MRWLLTFLAVLLLITCAHAQEIQPVSVSVDFQVNGTAVTMRVPPKFTVVTDPETLEATSYPEDQNLYFVLRPTACRDNRFVAIGSRPDLDAQDMSSKAFAAMNASIAKDMASGELEDEFEDTIASLTSLTNKWREKKGLPGFQSATILDVKAADDALVTTAIVLNEDGSEWMNCVRLQHVKNRIIVMAVSSHLTTKDDIAWVLSTSDRLKGSVR